MLYLFFSDHVENGGYSNDYLRFSIFVFAFIVVTFIALYYRIAHTTAKVVTVSLHGLKWTISMVEDRLKVCD